MANQILLSVENKPLSVAPGATADLAVTVQNLTTLLDQVAVRAEGIDASWVQVIPLYLPVFAQGEATARVVFQPPSDPAKSIAGVYRLRLCGTSQEYPGQEGDAPAELTVQLVGDYRIWLEPGPSANGQGASFTLHVQNGANAPLRLQFKGADSTDALWYKFDPYQAVVPPGAQSNVLLTLKSKDKATDARTVAFAVTAQGEFSPTGIAPVTAPAHQVAGQFVQAAPARLTLTAQPPQRQAPDRLVSQLQVGNPGTSIVHVQLTGSADGGNVDLDLQPSQLTLAAQSQANIRLVILPRSVLAPGERKLTTCQVTARAVDGETLPAAARVTFEQVGPERAAPARPSILPWVIALGFLVLFAIFAMLIVALFGFGIVR